MVCEPRGTQGFSSSSKLIDEKKVFLIALTHGGVEALATGSANSSATDIVTHFFYSLMKLNYNPDFTKCEILVPEGQKHIPSYISCSSPG